SRRRGVSNQRCSVKLFMHLLWPTESCARKSQNGNRRRAGGSPPVEFSFPGGNRLWEERMTLMSLRRHEAVEQRRRRRRGDCVGRRRDRQTAAQHVGVWAGD